MQKHYVVVLIRTRQEGLQTKMWANAFFAAAPEPGVFNEGIALTMLRGAVNEYLGTKEGKEAAQKTCYDYNWGDAIMTVPNSIWASHGLSVASAAHSPFMCVDAIALMVNQDEILCSAENDGHDEEGVCPLCGAGIEYAGENDIDDDGGVLPWECPNCGATGKEGYNRTFDRHYNVCDAAGIPIPDREQKGLVM